MAMTHSNPGSVEDELLPDEYDTLVPADELRHGEHNPRRVTPSDELRRSIAESGLQRPLIVRPSDNGEWYHITDGWQRYQAATDCGWESLPVRIFESTLDALQEAEAESIVREWDTYAWARHCQAIASEVESDSRNDLVEQVADRTTKSPRTVWRYLEVLSLPDVIHPLLIDGPEGSKQAWTTLQNYNKDIRRYEGLQWTVAVKISRYQADLNKERVIGVATRAVEFDDVDNATEFVESTADNPQKPLDIVRREVLIGQKHTRAIEVPRLVVSMERNKKRALMGYCRNQRQSLSDLVSEMLESFAKDIKDD